MHKKRVVAPPKVKALLIIGPPGTGKTTTCHLVAKVKGWMPLEFNASDSRSGAAIKTKILASTHQQSIHNFTSENKDSKQIQKKNSKQKTQQKRTVLILDEIDGISNKDDHGGAGSIICLIQETLIPVLCICNNNIKAISSLKKYCTELKWEKPNSRLITGYILKILEKENIKVEFNSLTPLIESCKGDIRQAINAAQLTYLQNNPSLAHYEYRQKKEEKEKEKKVNNGMKDFQVTIIGAVQQLLNPIKELKDIKNVKWAEERLNYYFQDNLMIPLMMRENYLKPTLITPVTERSLHNSYPYLTPSEKKQKKQDKRRAYMMLLEQIADASDSIAEAAIVERILSQTQNQELRSTIGLMNTVAPALLIRENRNNNNNNNNNNERCTLINTGSFDITFPKELINISIQTKNLRKLQEMVYATNHGSIDETALATEVLPYTRSKIFYHLNSANSFPSSTSINSIPTNIGLNSSNSTSNFSSDSKATKTKITKSTTIAKLKENKENVMRATTNAVNNVLGLFATNTNFGIDLETPLQAADNLYINLPKETSLIYSKLTERVRSYLRNAAEPKDDIIDKKKKGKF